MPRTTAVGKRTRFHGPLASTLRGERLRLRTGLLSCLALFAVILACGSAAGQCIDYGDYLHWVGGVDMPFYTFGYGIAVSGNIAYVCDGSLEVIDITDPNAPAYLGRLTTPGEASDVAVAGTLACVADGDSGLLVVDVTLPDAPEIVGNVDTPGSPIDVAVLGNYAYVADRYAGFHVIDISNPTDPVIVSSIDGWVTGVAVSGNYVYAAIQPGLRVIDVTNPASPVIVGSVDMPYGPWKVTVAEDYAYVTFATWFDGGVQVIDVRDPANPEFLGSVLFTGSADQVAISGNTAYVTSPSYLGGGDGGFLQVIDVADPTAPAILSKARIHDPRGIALEGDSAYIVANRAFDMNSTCCRLDVFDITHAASPPVVGAVGIPNQANDVAVSGNYAYVADGSSGLQVIEFTPPDAPEIVGNVDTPGSESWGVAVSGNYAYVADTDAGLQVIDITNPVAPVILAGVDTPGSAIDVTVAGPLAYVADGPSGLQVIDITNPATPVMLGGVDTPGFARGVAVSGNHAYVADDFSGLQVVDITNPAAPVNVGSVEIPSQETMSVAVSGQYAYVTEAIPPLWGGGLDVIDITNPVAPVIVSSLDMPGAAWDVAVSGDTAYVLDETGLRVIDVTNPVAPAIVGSEDTFSRAWAVAVSGSYAYVADYDSVRIVPAQCEEETAVEIEGFSVAELLLAPPTPNPTGGPVRIRCSLARQTHLSLRIYDVQGRRVAELFDGLLPSGTHAFDWNGKSSMEAVPAGIYFVRLETDTLVRMARLTVLR